MILITYQLSEVGRKVELLAGRDGGETTRSVVVPIDAPEAARVVELGRLEGSDCVLHLDEDFSYSNDPSHLTYAAWDHVPAASELLADRDARAAARDLARARREKMAHAETLVVLTERRTRESREYVRGEYVTVVVPDWPDRTDPSILESEEAKSWVADLEDERRRVIDEARTKAEAGKAAAQARREAEAVEKAAAKAARRAERGLQDGERDYNIDAGALMGVPCWESHQRGKNWFAIISKDHSAPGGLNREFAEKGKGCAYYLLPSLSPGDPVEFGADYYSGRGRASRHRWYGYVVRVEPDYLVLHECETGAQAIKQGTRYAASLAQAS